MSSIEEEEEVKAEENVSGVTTENVAVVSASLLSDGQNPDLEYSQYPVSLAPVETTPNPAGEGGGGGYYFPPHAELSPEDGQPSVVLGGSLTLEDLRAAVQHFTQERDWEQYHSPRNLVLALMSEVGELAEMFQWRNEVERGLLDFSDEEKNQVAEEIADVLLHLIRLSDVCGFDLGQAAINKLQINAQKYPPEQVRGSALKYTAYDPARQRREKYDIPTTRKHEEESGRKRARERFSEDQVAAMTELAEKAGWSITALTWEERVKFCQDFNITKVREKHSIPSSSTCFVV